MAAERAGPADPARAWAPYEPGPERPWNLARAGHLLRRATFGGTRREIEAALAAGPGRAVDGLLRPGADGSAFEREQEAAESAAASEEGLRAWWLRRMLRTPHPLLERMTFFWSGALAIGNLRSPPASLLLGRQRTIRRHALGRFDDLLGGVVRDPATLLSLGAEAGRKARPPEHLARTVLDAYAAGPGGYSEADVKETARALTGRFVLRGELREIPREHDDGPKTILGASGSFGAGEAAGVIARAPATARAVAARVYRAFVAEHPEPGDDLLAPLVEGFRKDRDIAGLIGTVLRSNLFFSDAAYRARVKGPVEWALGLVRALEAEPSTVALAEDLARLGQDVLRPPTPRGWEGGRSWLDPLAAAARACVAARLAGSGKPYEGKLDPFAAAERAGAGGSGGAGFLIDLLLDGNLEAPVREALLGGEGGEAGPEGMRRIAWRIAVLPESQLA